MKKTIHCALLALAVSLGASAQQRIAYVDLERLNENYGLKVELDEQFKTLYDKTHAELEAKQKEMETKYNALSRQIENKGKAIAAKMKKTPATGGYKTEAEYNRDQQAVTRMQTDAQKKMETMQADYAALEQKRTEELQTRQEAFTKTITDSVAHFVARYNEEKSYDYILIKAATLFCNPTLDVTDEILSGLNKEYEAAKPKEAPAEGTEK